MDLRYLKEHPAQLPVFIKHQRIRETPVPGGSICTAQRLTFDDGGSIFCKSLADPPEGFFAAEAAGLRWLRESGAVPVPEVVVELPELLALEWIEHGEATPGGAERLGRRLATLHRAGAPSFGAPWTGFIGTAPLPNDASDGPWPAWFAQRRLLPFLRISIDNGALTGADVAGVERVIAGIEGYGGAEPRAGSTVICGLATSSGTVTETAGSSTRPRTAGTARPTWRCSACGAARRITTGSWPLTVRCGRSRTAGRTASRCTGSIFCWYTRRCSVPLIVSRYAPRCEPSELSYRWGTVSGMTLSEPPGAGLADRHGRVATDLRVSLTDRCNLRCTYCMPAEGLDWLPNPTLLTDDEVVRLIGVAVTQLGITEVRFTGGEPLLRRGLAGIVRAVAAMQPRPSTMLTTNGVGLARLAGTLAEAGLDRVNVSLDTVDPARFQTLTRRDRHADVLAGLAASAEAGLVPVKMNAVLLRGVNDDEAVPLLRFALEHGYELRFIEQMPLDAGHTWRREEMVTGEEILGRLREAFDLRPDPALRGVRPPRPGWSTAMPASAEGRPGWA